MENKSAQLAFLTPFYIFKIIIIAYCDSTGFENSSDLRLIIFNVLKSNCLD